MQEEGGLVRFIKILNEPSPKLLTTWYAEQVGGGGGK